MPNVMGRRTRGPKAGARNMRASGVAEAGEAVVRTVAQRDISQRRREKSLSMPKGKLSARELPGFHICWVYAPQVHEFLDAEYEYVLTSDYGTAEQSDGTDTQIKRIHGSNEAGGVYSYLMKIRQEWYDEDQAIHQEYCDKVDAAIEGGALERGDADDVKHAYVPKSGISLQPKPFA
jgi:hypothetical protein